MSSRLVKLALVSFLSITALLGAHHFHAHPRAKQVSSPQERWETAKQGSPTFFNTNPFGMPRDDRSIHSQSNAASYGLTPPTSYTALSEQAATQPSSKWKYWGLLGLLGLLGFANRSKAAR
ncbi:hypothetical protein [Paenibacillus sp. SI8]|uniref:hypothetical protein n=1 Tax=unclassified Paenibacillus TaxID=185978 RepID=UPI00346674F5